jgi:hypothetical protein
VLTSPTLFEAGIQEISMATRTDIVPFELADGKTIHVSVTQLGGEEKVSLSKKLFSFDEVTSSIESIANSLAKTIDKVTPQKASIEFGLEVAIESGNLTALLTKGSATANLVVTLEWEKSKTPPSHQVPASTQTKTTTEAGKPVAT